ncbi:MAG: D-alanyl-D-alanine carboxypeptidase family protein [Eubacteriales bacterium]|nr:D-alanyl-D-alanine carboxypeptidase family protein [Eubacteriales bacterium]
MRIKKFIAGLLALGIAASAPFQIPVSAAEETAETADTADNASAISTNSIAGWPQGPDITSTAAIVMEDSTNTILYAKNMDQPLYPGSAVKIMTTLLALENASLDDQVTMTATGVSGVTDGGANISAQLDEVFTMEQCLYAIMLASANDIALQVAEHIGGSVEAFVEKMNARAQELGCTNTVFTNPTGLPDENQHITAHDMALIMQAAIDNADFRTIASAASYTIPATNVSGGARALTNNFTMLKSTDASYYQGCLGGKEGYTEASASTLATAAERNGIILISVVLQGASGQTYNEAITTLDYGFNNFQKLSLGENDFNLISGGTVIIPNTATEADVAAQDTEADGEIARQYYFGGTPVGTATLMANQEQDNSIAVEGEANLKAAQDFSANKSAGMYYVIGGIGAALLLLLIFLMVKVIKS